MPAQLQLQAPKPNTQSARYVACSEAGHVFTPQPDDWGFAQDVLYAPDAGFLSSDGRLTITLMVHISHWARLSLHEDLVCYLMLAQSTFTLSHALPPSKVVMITEQYALCAGTTFCSQQPSCYHFKVVSKGQDTAKEAFIESVASTHGRCCASRFTQYYQSAKNALLALWSLLPCDLVSAIWCRSQLVWPVCWS